MIRTKKRRGRPNKKAVQLKKERQQLHYTEETDIIITLPYCSEDKESETINSSNSDGGDYVDNANDVGTVDDIDIDNDIDNDNDNEKDYYTINYSEENNELGYISECSNKTDLYKEIEERDNLIKKLKDINMNLRKDLENMNKDIKQKYEITELKKKLSEASILNIDGNKIVLNSKCKVDCAHCTLPVSDIPWLMPYAYINGCYYVNDKRIFCSPNCSLRYNDRILCDHRQKIRHGLIIKMYQEICNTDKPLKSALDPEDCLDKFGKTLTPSEYKKSLNILTSNSKDVLPLMIPCITIEEAQNKGITCTNVI
jgi:hypothetical protein